MSKAKAYKEPKTFEEAIERLQQLVDALEEGDVPLEQSLEAFEEGQLLTAYCQQKLAGAEETLKKLASEASDELDGEEN
ncbi:exodeoxyribonuclease VII small subunit [bacterium]|nr:exodeoxyribonuclease VII small subunit [bacterium]MBU1637708.1 exodeoxyribonuclease VII small subunit [bacterium]MBU1920048.1 exodeoxyribonuclease VII small subunit [bacterium]RQV99430.1 MAG: exodeoxyribonuclease VII small subunit [bacterium]